MGNEQVMPSERHVSFENRAIQQGRSFDPRYSYDLAPNMRSREFNMGQRFQERTQVRTNFPNEQWNNYQPGGGTTRTVTRQEWHGGGYDGRRQPQDQGGYEEYDWNSSARGQRPYTQRTTYVSNSRGGRPTDDWHQQTTGGYYTPRQSTTSYTRSYETDGNYPGGDGPYHPRGGRPFNTRDYDDQWYHYKPVVNRRPDWALVGRHVLARPASASVRQVKTVEQDFRRLRDFDTFSDPASYGGPGGVRQTFNPRFPRAQQAISNYQDNWMDEVETGIRRPTQSSYYKTYSVNSYR